MKFKADENLPNEVAELLRNQGFDIHTVWDEGITGASDSRVFAACKTENRILITLDLDFADIRQYPPNASPGIVVLRLFRQDKQSISGIIERLIPVLQKESVTGRMWIVEENRIRIRE